MLWLPHHGLPGPQETAAPLTCSGSGCVACSLEKKGKEKKEDNSCLQILDFWLFKSRILDIILKKTFMLEISFSFLSWPFWESCSVQGEG